VAVFPDGPERYWNTLFDDGFCHERGLLAAPLPLAPDEIGHPRERVVRAWTRCRMVTDPRQERRSVERTPKDRSSAAGASAELPPVSMRGGAR
jgi:cysteine synthase A